MSGFRLIRTPEQWRRALLKGTVLDERAGEVSLSWETEESWAARHNVGASASGGPSGPSAGAGASAASAGARKVLAFDSGKRIYWLEPGRGLWRRHWTLTPAAFGGKGLPPAEDVLGMLGVGGPGQAAGAAFAPAVRPDPQRLVDLCIDEDDYLYLAEADADAPPPAGTERGGWLWIFDLQERRLLRRARLPAPPRALGCQGVTVHCLTADGTLHRLVARRAPIALGLVGGPAAAAAPASGAPRLLATPAGLVLLIQAGTPDAQVVPVYAGPGPAPAQAPAPVRVPGASDITLLGQDTLVTARGAGQDLLCHSLGPRPAVVLPLRAWDHRGDGIASTPDGRIAYLLGAGSAGTVRHAFTAPVRYRDRGYVLCPVLDGGEYQTEWGRLFLDACLPPATDVRVLCLTSDERPEDGGGPPAALVPRALAAVLAGADPPAAGAPPDEMDEADETALRALFRPLYRREEGSDLPWPRTEADNPVHQTLEAPVLLPTSLASPGRYLWVVLELSGSTRATPRVRTVRVEFPGHALLRRLPQVYWRDPAAASFLRRYLAPVAGVLGELEARAVTRHALLDPAGAPAGALPWLGGLLGLSPLLDERWSEDQTRRLIAEASALQRDKGTAAGVLRLLEICTGGPVRVLEHYGLRGGSALLGEPRGSIVGGGLQSGTGGGTLQKDRPADPGASTDPCRDQAHRCTFLVLSELTPEQRQAAQHLIDRWRPAHVVWDLCLLGGGMRLGMGARVGLSAVVGRGLGFRQLRVGATVGRDGLLGQPWRAVPAGDGQGS